MAKEFGLLVSPCIDVCKYRKSGACKGCGMTKPEKRDFKKLSRQEQITLISELLIRLKKKPKKLTKFRSKYYEKCSRKGNKAGALTRSVLDVVFTGSESDQAA